ncbi:diguanylate phosphodiesterase, partial [Listeria monocytogenes]|nr:diguanylate phosphodiesterase [Listeria monocytogenes]
MSFMAHMLYYLECTNFHMLFWKGEIFI